MSAGRIRSPRDCRPPPVLAGVPQGGRHRMCRDRRFCCRQGDMRSRWHRRARATVAAMFRQPNVTTGTKEVVARHNIAGAPLHHHRSQLSEATEALGDGLEVPVTWIPRMEGEAADRDGEGPQLGRDRLGRGGRRRPGSWGRGARRVRVEVGVSVAFMILAPLRYRWAPALRGRRLAERDAVTARGRPGQQPADLQGPI